MNGKLKDGNSPEVSGGSVGYGINPKGIIYSGGIHKEI